jgi:hypothetical protein
MTGHKIKVSDIYELKDGKLVVNQKRKLAKLPVCARYGKKNAVKVVSRRSASSVNRTP